MKPWVPLVLYAIWVALFIWVIFIARQARQLSGRVASLEATRGDVRCGDRCPTTFPGVQPYYCQAPVGHPGDHRAGSTWWGPITPGATP